MLDRLLLMTALAPALVAASPDPARPSPSAPSARAEPAQDDQAMVRAWMKILRDKRVSESDRDDAFEELLALGSSGPLALTEHYGKEAERAAKSNEKDLKRFLKSFDRDARKLIEDRVDRDAEDAIDGHRKTIMAGARDQDLTKERIEAESDPAFEALEALLTVDAEAVLAADEDLADDHAELTAAADREEMLRGRWELAREALERADAEEAADLDPLEEAVLTPDRLEAILAERADLARPMSRSDERVFEENAELAKEIEPLEAAGIRYLNLRLVLIGLPAQQIDPKLCAACRDHSKDMKEIGFFAHESPVEGKKDFGTRASNFGTSASSENIAHGSNDPVSTIMQWWYSPGHHRNMLGGKGRTGLGYFETYWTQNFG